MPSGYIWPKALDERKPSDADITEAAEFLAKWDWAHLEWLELRRRMFGQPVTNRRIMNFHYSLCLNKTGKEKERVSEILKHMERDCLKIKDCTCIQLADGRIMMDKITPSCPLHGKRYDPRRSL